MKASKMKLSLNNDRLKQQIQGRISEIRENKFKNLMKKRKKLKIINDFFFLRDLKNQNKINQKKKLNLVCENMSR